MPAEGGQFAAVCTSCFRWQRPVLCLLLVLTVYSIYCTYCTGHTTCGFMWYRCARPVKNIYIIYWTKHYALQDSWIETVYCEQFLKYIFHHSIIILNMIWDRSKLIPTHISEQCALKIRYYKKNMFLFIANAFHRNIC